MGKGKRVEIKGKTLCCGHCEWDRFKRHIVQLNTAGMTFLDLDFLNQSAEVLQCTSCGYLHWFLGSDIREEEDLSEASDCLACGKVIPPGKTACPTCGWSYK